MSQSDPNEMQTPICQVITEPKHDPNGGKLKHTAHLDVLVPMFGSDTHPADAMACPSGGRRGEMCGTTLGSTLISILGHIPEAWLTHPDVAIRCPDPNNLVPGTCTMHASSVDRPAADGPTGNTSARAAEYHRRPARWPTACVLGSTLCTGRAFAALRHSSS